MFLRNWTWLAPTLGFVAFIAVFAAFALELVSFSADVEGWARRDLMARVELAAKTIEEPLRTQDFRAVRTFADECRRHGLDLRVENAHGGLIFDSHERTAPHSPNDYVARHNCGDYAISLFLPSARVHEPFVRALRGFAIAALLGVVGMFVVFFALYRQRVRIRELARLERFRREFVADVSHEIKTPLTGILGAVDLLKESADEAQPVVHRLLDMIARESNRLNALVQQILDLARLERADLSVECIETDISALVRERVEDFRLAAEKAGVTLTVSATSPLVVRCDPRLIAQALSNLLTNAFRHAQSPDIFVSATRMGHQVALVVEDHGIGIPPSEAARIFERFHRIDPSRAAESGGAGLGLAIVRRIARLHGGDVVFEPVRPHGARFVLTIAERVLV